MQNSENWHRTLAHSGAVVLLAMIALTAAACISTSKSSREAAGVQPASPVTQTSSSGRDMKSPTPVKPKSTASPAAQPQPAVSAASRPLQLSKVFIPVVEKDGNPLAFQARLPLLSKANDDSTSSGIEASFKEKTILVDISDQHVYAYDKGKLVFSFSASTGRKNLTRAGHYRILDKNPNAYSDPWGFWMPYWMGIYYAGYNLENGFHSLPVLSNGKQLWGSKIGSPVTYGCVVLLPDDMKKLYRWAGIGTAVVIQR